jgi:hypothetical protein
MKTNLCSVAMWLVIGLMLSSGPAGAQSSDGQPGGAPRPTSTFSSHPPEPPMPLKCSIGAFTDDTSPDQLLDLVSAPSGPGFCIEANGKLTGSCAESLHVGLGCYVHSSPSCRKGAVAKKPTTLECCGFLRCVQETVDLDASCH